jgi:glycosyltransferase involved in cell wall biosynthesis
MRINCVLGPYLPVPPLRGGAVERIWESLCREFAAAGHAVTLVSRGFASLPNEEERDGVRYLRVASRDAPTSRLLYRTYDVAYAWRVARALPSADVTVTNSVSLPLLLPRRRAGHIYVSVARFPKGQMPFYFRASRLQAVSKSVADEICRQAPAMAGRVRTLPNALSPAFLEACTRDVQHREREVLFVGRLAREKGLHLLLDAFIGIRGHDDWHLTLMGPHEAAEGGDGRDFLEELKAKARDAGGRIRLESPIFDENHLAQRMLRAMVFAYPSVAELGESFGMAPLEAMACGCAVVVSDLSCFREFIVPNENGIAFNHRQDGVAHLGAALQELIEKPQLAAALGDEGRRTAVRYGARTVAAHFLKDFETLGSGGSPQAEAVSRASV